MAETWEEYAPPVFPLGTVLSPTLTFDFLQGTITINRDALLHLECYRVKIRAIREQCVLELHPIFSTEANGLTIDRNGKLRGARGLMQWLRMDPKLSDARMVSLMPKPNGLLYATYDEAVTPRAAKAARKARGE